MWHISGIKEIHGKKSYYSLLESSPPEDIED
jgi:hypothetical protein